MWFCLSLYICVCLCVCLSVCLYLYSYNYDLVFGVSVHGLNKADRLIYGESLMTHAMVLTAVHEEVVNLSHFCPVCQCHLRNT